MRNEKTAEILRNAGLDYSAQEVADWLLGGEPSANPTAEELAEQIVEYEGVVL